MTATTIGTPDIPRDDQGRYRSKPLPSMRVEGTAAILIERRHLFVRQGDEIGIILGVVALRHGWMLATVLIVQPALGGDIVAVNSLAS